MRAAEHYKVHAVGVTLSKHQFEYVSREIRERELVNRCNAYLMDYGITSSTFDNETISYGPRNFIDRYVFRDGELTDVSKVVEVMSRHGLECLDVENLRSLCQDAMALGGTP